MLIVEKNVNICLWLINLRFYLVFLVNVSYEGLTCLLRTSTSASLPCHRAEHLKLGEFKCRASFIPESLCFIPIVNYREEGTVSNTAWKLTR